MWNHSSASKPISASHRNRIHSVSASMLLRSPRPDQDNNCWAIAWFVGLAFLSSRNPLSWRNAVAWYTLWQTGSCLCVLSTWILWEFQLSLYNQFYQLSLKLNSNWFQFYRYIFSFTVLFQSRWIIRNSTPRMHWLQILFKHSYHVLVVDIFSRWCLSFLLAFHDQPEEDSGC